MTIRDTPFAPGTPCWVDLLSSDTESSKAFYGALFGWVANEAREDLHGYVTFTSDGHPVAGMMGRMPGMDSPDVWSTYLATDNIDASVDAATLAGAQVLASPMDVADLGRMALLIDPAGAGLGLWHAITFPGFGKYNEPGAVTWDEVLSKNFTTSVSFYEQVFGWTIETMADTEEFRYVTGQVNGDTVAGLMDAHTFLPTEVPSHWAVYFSVTDTDEAAAKTAALGGTVLRPAEDTPFGRLAEVADPTGAPFKLHSTKMADGSTLASN
ncbi:MAG: putative hydroxylase [Frankiales bacterium]|nr:putative hydroxylase [Frankiales bacterium]